MEATKDFLQKQSAVLAMHDKVGYNIALSKWGGFWVAI